MNVRVNLLAIIVLSICSTCAHAQFDTVINLPENLGSPNPSGFSGNSIGNDSGIPSDTQLNVSDGGSIGFRFDAGAEGGSSTNIEVNISGGEVGGLFDAFGGSTVNISGGPSEVTSTPKMAASSTSREGKLVASSTHSVAAPSTSREGHSEMISTCKISALSISREGHSEMNSTHSVAALSISREGHSEMTSTHSVAAPSTYRGGGSC